MLIKWLGLLDCSNPTRIITHRATNKLWNGTFIGPWKITDYHSGYLLISTSVCLLIQFIRERIPNFGIEDNDGKPHRMEMAGLQTKNFLEKLLPYDHFMNRTLVLISMILPTTFQAPSWQSCFASIRQGQAQWQRKPRLLYPSWRCALRIWYR